MGDRFLQNGKNGLVLHTDVGIQVTGNVANYSELTKDYQPVPKRQPAQKKSTVEQKARLYPKHMDFEDNRLYVLTRAIENRIGIDGEEARRDAGFVMDIFGYDDRVIDNILQPEDRQLFYILEEEGMIETQREETILYDGREWRTHYWRLKKDVIMRYSKEQKIEPQKSEPKKESEKDFYENLWDSEKKEDKEEQG